MVVSEFWCDLPLVCPHNGELKNAGQEDPSHCPHASLRTIN